ncbi:lytic transglycosylase domain-containing protein [Methylococcus sp. ANG]|uniref:lytic transglycosylase domain-containing protein n=1 Tax=Methylococcus sp. ANG TaxID=3231903 RepID=UPI00345769C7
MNAEMKRVAIQAACTNDIPAAWVLAIIEVESSGRWDATRREPGYRWFWGKITNNQERIGQSTSYGPMQVMGAVARELGFKGQFETLCGPLGVVYGCLHLAGLIRRFGLTDGAIRAYNTGNSKPSKAGDRYLAKVKSAMEKWTC